VLVRNLPNDKAPQDYDARPEQPWIANEQDELARSS